MTRARRWCAAVLALTALSACSGQPSDGGAGTPASAGASTATPSPASTDAGRVPAGQYRNPVVQDNMPDPAVLAAGGLFHLYTTQGSGSNVQTATSKDLIHWTKGPDALPSVGDWARSGNTWAPEVLALNGKFVMFYTATDIASGKQCIGRAESTSPGGPFADHAQ
jgi:beta-xylosidase